MALLFQYLHQLHSGKAQSTHGAQIDRLPRLPQIVSEKSIAVAVAVTAKN